MLLRLSRFVHLVPVGPDRVLVVDAISHVRETVSEKMAAIIRDFTTPREVAEVPAGSLVEGLMQRGIITDKDPGAELAHVSGLLGPFHGRDPDALLQEFRRKSKSGGEAYWAATAALQPEDFEASGPRVDVILFGDCDVHVESDFLRRAATGIDLHVAATFPSDLRLTSEHKHDAILIGLLEARHSILSEPAAGQAPHARFLAAMEKILTDLRKLTSAPILVDNLPEPTVQPMGMSERGAGGHRNRFRAANLALADLVETFTDVHIVDIAATLNAAGNERLLDDGYFGFSHFGSPGWLLQRAPSDLAAVHGQFPELDSFAAWTGGDPYGREALTARAHFAALQTVLGLDKKKCVIVDLDGTLWPGVLAETGSPFAWRPETSSPYSYVGLYFGIHEALLALKRRGILLACVSKNDEALVRSLWKYDSHYPPGVLLTPDDFVTWRVNWNDKVENISSIVSELGLAPESFVFVDDNPVERDRVRQRLPQIETWGDDLFALRRKLLNDPRLQTPTAGSQSAERTERTKAQLQRQKAQTESRSEEEFLATLNLEVKITPADAGADLARISELFARTTQFNTTGRQFPAETLKSLLTRPDSKIFIVHVKDRFTDHGLVGAVVLEGSEITGFALSCRVLGLGVEHTILQHVMKQAKTLQARIIPTERNMPVRHLYRDNGFSEQEKGLWVR